MKIAHNIILFCNRHVSLDSGFRHTKANLATPVRLKLTNHHASTPITTQMDTSYFQHAQPFLEQQRVAYENFQQFGDVRDQVQEAQDYKSNFDARVQTQKDPIVRRAPVDFTSIGYSVDHVNRQGSAEPNMIDSADWEKLLDQEKSINTTNSGKQSMLQNNSVNYNNGVNVSGCIEDSIHSSHLPANITDANLLFSRSDKSFIESTCTGRKSNASVYSLSKSDNKPSSSNNPVSSYSTFDSNKETRANMDNQSQVSYTTGSLYNNERCDDNTVSQLSKDITPKAHNESYQSRTNIDISDFKNSYREYQENTELTSSNFRDNKSSQESIRLFELFLTIFC